MPVTLNSIVSNSARVTLNFENGGSLNIDYYPSRITRKTFADLTTFSEMSEVGIMENLDSLIDLLINLVKTWDLLEDDNTTPIALTAERLATVPVVVLGLVSQTILGDIRPEAIALQVK